METQRTEGAKEARLNPRQKRFTEVQQTRVVAGENFSICRGLEAPTANLFLFQLHNVLSQLHDVFSRLLAGLCTRLLRLFMNYEAHYIICS